MSQPTSSRRRRTRGLIATAAVATLLAASGMLSAAPGDVSELESPFAECTKWTYPNLDVCGKWKGLTECKSEPSINSAGSAEQKEKCKPEEGADCTCEDEDDDDDDDDDFDF